MYKNRQIDRQLQLHHTTVQRWTCLLYCASAPARRHASLQILCKCPTPAFGFGNATKPSRFVHFCPGAQSLALATQNHIWTFKSGPGMLCFQHVDLEMCFAPQPRTLSASLHFDFEMCFAPQRRALFRHLNFQKCSETISFLHFWLWNVLRATTACTFSTSQEKHKCFATFLPLHAPASSFFWPFLFSDRLSSSLLFSSLTLPTSDFPSVHIVGSLTSKLPSMIDYTLM